MSEGVGESDVRLKSFKWYCGPVGAEESVHEVRIPGA